MLERASYELGRTGNVSDGVFARIIDNLLNLRGKDILFPEPSVTFTNQDKVELRNSGIEVYRLPRKTIAQHIEDESLGYSRWLQGEPFLHDPSPFLEVAVNPNNPFLPGSEDKPFVEQVRMVEEYGADIESQYPGLTAILGPISTYVDLLSANSTLTDKPIIDFTKKQLIVRTATIGSERRGVDVDFHRDSQGIFQIRFSDRDYHSQYHIVLPLIVPAVAVGMRT